MNTLYVIHTLFPKVQCVPKKKKFSFLEHGEKNTIFSEHYEIVSANNKSRRNGVARPCCLICYWLQVTGPR